MKDQEPVRGVERMFPFVLRARALIVGRELLLRSKRRLHFVLVTDDLSEKTRAQVLSEFAHYPVVQHYTSADLENHFGVLSLEGFGLAGRPEGPVRRRVNPQRVRSLGNSEHGFSAVSRAGSIGELERHTTAAGLGRLSTQSPLAPNHRPGLVRVCNLRATCRHPGTKGARRVDRLLRPAEWPRTVGPYQQSSIQRDSGR